MRILDRYLAKAIAQASLLVLFMLLAIDLAFAMISEMDDVGKGGYQLLDAMWYVALTVPRRCYVLFPMAVLLGSLVGLGALASHSEFIVMRAAGVSNRRILWSAAMTGIGLSVLMLGFGEVVAPSSERAAQLLRADRVQGRVSLQGKDGLWVRNAKRYVNVKQLLPGMHLQNVTIYDFSSPQGMVATRARAGRYQDGVWILDDIERSRVSDGGVQLESVARESWETLVDPTLFDVLLVKPDSLSVVDLRNYINHLQTNDLDARRYELEFWRKLVAPATTFIMLMIAVPFVFGDHRSTGTGHRLLIGCMIGIVYFLADRLFAHVGLIYGGISPLVSAFLPPLAFALAAVLLLRRVVR
jgi:lipopolysaccharide export system permease protein